MTLNYEQKIEENLEMEKPPVEIQKPDTEYSCNKFACSNDCWDTFVKEAQAILKTGWIEALEWVFDATTSEETQERILNKLKELRAE